MIVCESHFDLPLLPEVEDRREAREGRTETGVM